MERRGLISMFDKDDIEQLGLVKFDFLGIEEFNDFGYGSRRLINSTPVNV